MSETVRRIESKLAAVLSGGTLCAAGVTLGTMQDITVSAFLFAIAGGCLVFLATDR